MFKKFTTCSLLCVGLFSASLAHAEVIPAFDVPLESGASTVEAHKNCELYPFPQQLCVVVYVDNASHSTPYSFQGVDMGNPSVQGKATLTIYRMKSDSGNPFVFMGIGGKPILDSAGQQMVFDPNAPSGTDILVIQEGTHRTVLSADAQSDSVMQKMPPITILQAGTGYQVYDHVHTDQSWDGVILSVNANGGVTSLLIISQSVVTSDTHHVLTTSGHGSDLVFSIQQ